MRPHMTGLLPATLGRGRVSGGMLASAPAGDVIGVADWKVSCGEVSITSSAPWTSRSSGACEANDIAVDAGGRVFVSGVDGVTFYDGELMNHDGAYLNPASGSYQTNGAGAHAVAAFADGSIATSIGATIVLFPADPTLAAIKTIPMATATGGLAASHDGGVLYSAVATAGHVVVRRLINPSLPTPTLTVSSTKRMIAFGGTLTVSAHLGGQHTNAAVRIYGRHSDGSIVKVAEGAVNAGGVLSKTVHPGQNTSYFAEYDGDAGSSSAISLSIPVYVHDVVTTVARNAYAVRSGIRLFKYRTSCITSGVGCPTFTLHVSPSHAGQKVSVYIEHRSVSGSWQEAGTTSFRLNRRSSVSVFHHYRTSSARSGYWRVRSSFPNDGDHMYGSSGWVTYRVVL